MLSVHCLCFAVWLLLSALWCVCTVAVVSASIVTVCLLWCGCVVSVASGSAQYVLWFCVVCGVVLTFGLCLIDTVNRAYAV